MSDDLLPGRDIAPEPFTGLVERLCQLTTICNVVAEASGDLEHQDLVSLFEQFKGLCMEALAFAGATPEEAAEMSRKVLAGLSFGPRDH